MVLTYEHYGLNYIYIYIVKIILFMYSIMPSRKVSMRSSLTNKTSIFGIMGGLYPRKISGRSSMNRVTSRLEIPASAAAGYEYMKMHNLLSRNPLGSGGVGRMFTVRPRGSGLGNVKTTTKRLGDSLGMYGDCIPNGEECGPPNGEDRGCCFHCTDPTRPADGGGPWCTQTPPSKSLGDSLGDPGGGCIANGEECGPPNGEDRGCCFHCTDPTRPADGGGPWCTQTPPSI
jgi:hypothetical protein